MKHKYFKDSTGNHFFRQTEGSDKILHVLMAITHQENEQIFDRTVVTSTIKVGDVCINHIKKLPDRNNLFETNAATFANAAKYAVYNLQILELLKEPKAVKKRSPKKILFTVSELRALKPGDEVLYYFKSYDGGRGDFDKIKVIGMNDLYIEFDNGYDFCFEDWNMDCDNYAHDITKRNDDEPAKYDNGEHVVAVYKIPQE